MSLMCLRSWLAIYQSGDPALQWGGIEDPFIREAAVWFVTFLAVDTVLMLLHGFGGRDLVVHHAIFFACYAAAPSSSAPIITGVLIGQEVSTPFLNVFLLLRGFKGMDSALTRAFFILFALAFFAARLVLNTYVTGLLWLRALSIARFGKPEYMVLSEPTYLFFGLVLTAGCALQLFWAVGIAKKVRSALSRPKGEHKTHNLKARS